VPRARSLRDDVTPPPGGVDRILANARARRVRNVAIWSIALFVASVPVALVSSIGTDGAGEATVGTALAILCWLIGFGTCIWSFGLAFRHWEALPLGTRWLASLPLLVVLFLLALSMVVTIVRAAV
jgi:hypothetical protein